MGCAICTVGIVQITEKVWCKVDEIICLRSKMAPLQLEYSMYRHIVCTCLQAVSKGVGVGAIGIIFSVSRLVNALSMPFVGKLV